MLQDMERDRDKIERDLANIVFHLNGGLNFIDAYGLTTNQLKHLSEAVNDHFEKQAEAFKNAQRKRS